MEEILPITFYAAAWELPGRLRLQNSGNPRNSVPGRSGISKKLPVTSIEADTIPGRKTSVKGICFPEYRQKERKGTYPVIQRSAMIKSAEKDLAAIPALFGCPVPDGVLEPSYKKKIPVSRDLFWQRNMRRTA